MCERLGTQRSARPISCVIRIRVVLSVRGHLEQEVHHLLAGGAVEIAGRLVGQHQLGPADEGARHGDALLFAAGKLCRDNGRGDGRARPASARALRSSKASERPANSSGSADVLVRRHGRNEVKALENDAEMVAARSVPGVVAAVGPISLAGDLDLADVARSSPPATIIRLGLAGTRRRPTTAATSPAAMSRVMPRRILTMPASLAMSRCTSFETNNGMSARPRGLLGQAKNETASSIWWFCGSGQFTDRGVSGAGPVPCGRNSGLQRPSTNRAGEARHPGRQPGGRLWPRAGRRPSRPGCRRR